MEMKPKLLKIQSWSPDEWESNLNKRLDQAKRYRLQFERMWRENEKILFTDIGQYPDQIVVTEENLLRFDTGEEEVGQDQIGMNYAWKYVRFVHSQMSANPPTVMVRPASTDSDDRKKADAADRISRHLRRKLHVQEHVDQANLNALTYGNGYIRTKWDSLGGDLREFNKKTNEILMDGDISMYAPTPWNIYLDPNAKTWFDIGWFFERHEIPYHEAKFLFPDDAEMLDQHIRKRLGAGSELRENNALEEVVDVYEYIEKGMPINGMAGRKAFCMEDGKVLGEPMENDNPNQGLSLRIMGDSDVPGNIYNKTFVEYITKIQDFLNRFDSTIIDNIEAHLVVRMVLPEGAEIEDEAISNSGWDWIKMTGSAGNGPHFVSPPGLMPDAWRFREAALQGMQELAGVNDAMLGNSSREVSGFALQTMVDSGNTVRRRLFNKYTDFVELIYKDLLELAKENWEEERTIMVLGAERAFESESFSKADIDGGFDIVAEYGASLSLDPARRREEIQQLKPDLVEAGMSPRAIVQMYRLNELDSIYDRMAVASVRQQEIFDEIISEGKPVPVEEMMDHQGMLEHAYHYLMGAEFKYLKPDIKKLIEEHVKEREQAAAQAATKGQGAPQPGAEEGLPPEGEQPGAEGGAPLEALEGGG
jgi:hypothetical protein